METFLVLSTKWLGLKCYHSIILCGSLISAFGVMCEV